MHSVASALLLICFCLQVVAWLRVRTLVRNTSLISAWIWSAVSLVVWLLTVTMSVAGTLQVAGTPALLRVLSYSSVVVLLAPFVAILGARRPRTGAWNWFVVLPMLLVLHWPVVTTATGSGLTGFELPAPMMMGCVLVLTMGLGNSFGTRFTLPAVLMAAGMLWLLKTITFNTRGDDPEELRIVVSDALHVAGACYGLAALVFLIRNPRGDCSIPTDAAAAIDRLNQMWLDFQNVFGIVWAKRVMDRLNQFSQRERWPLRLELYGFEAKSEPPENPATEAAMLDRVRWVMRLFVDPEWLDERLGKTED